MFATLIAKTKPAAAASSSILQRRHSNAAIHQAHAQDKDIWQRGGEALPELASGEPGRLSDKMPLHNAGPAWDFTMIPVFPPERQRSCPPLHLQRKLAIGAVNDPLEQEADRVAEQVTRMPSAEVARTFAPPQVSRKCADCEAEEEEKLQKKEAGTAEAVPSEAPPIVHEVLRSPGQPLDAATRAFFEPRFGQDFSRVRVHTDTSAAQSARDVNAHAFTVGQDIVFGAGQYTPGTRKGQALLAHELVHVVQQAVGVVAPAQQSKNHPTSGTTSASPAIVQRQPAAVTPVGTITSNIGPSPLTIAHVPPCGRQPAIRFTAHPTSSAPITWSLDPGSAAIASGTVLTPSTSTLTADLALGAKQKGGTLEVKAENSAGGQMMPYPLASHPTGIASTSRIGNPTNTTSYGGVFDHEFTSNDGQASSLEDVAVGERFPTVPNPAGASHTFPTPFGSFTLKTGTLPTTPSRSSGNWFLTSAGELGGSHDTVDIQKSLVDIGRHLVSDSHPHPANPLPAEFTIDQQFFWWCPHGHSWTQAAATTHTRRLRLDPSGTSAEFVAIVNGKENAMPYEGMTGVTNARADPATAAPSAAAGPANTVQISADAFPASRHLFFSIQGNSRGCTINHATGELTIGTQTGTVKVRVANASGGANWDEVDVTIAPPSVPAPAPTPTPPSSPVPAPSPTPHSGSTSAPSIK